MLIHTIAEVVMPHYRYYLILIIAVAVSFPLHAESSWDLVSKDESIYHQDMLCLSSERCVVVGGIKVGAEYSAYIGISEDGGSTWKQAQYDLPKKTTDGINVLLLSVTATDSLHLFACGANGAILNSTDGGETWSTAANVKKWVYHFLSFSNSNIGIVGSRFGGVLLKTMDGGATWQDISIPSTPVIQQAVCLNADTLLALTGDIANIEAPHIFFRSTDGGKTWMQQEFYVQNYGGNPPLDIRITSMNFINGQEGFIAGVRKSSVQSAVIMKTIDRGQTWEVVLDTVVPGTATFGVEKLHIVENNALVAVCTDGRQFFSPDGGIEWHILSPSPLDNQPFYRASAFASLYSGYIIDGLHQIYRYNATTSIEKTDNIYIAGLPSVALRTVFPNPVNRATASIEAYMRQNRSLQQSSLKIYNIYGQEVKDVSAALQPLTASQVATISFEIENLQNGVYFLRISNGADNYTQGFVVAR